VYLQPNQYIMKNIAFFLVFLLSITFGFTQETEIDNENNYLLYENLEEDGISDSIIIPNKNIIKTNLSSIVLNNYSLQYERIFTKRFSLSLSYRLMPKGSLPMKKSLLNFIEDDNVDSDIEDIINNAEIGASAITLEPRLYIGKKGYGRGFYFAPYYRYSNFTLGNIGFNYTSDTGEQRRAALDGSISAHSGGLMIGAQWDLGSGFVLDWWIMGGHFGTSSGKVSGTPSVPLSENEQQEIRESIENIEFSDMIKEINISANGIDVSLDAPWLGVRAFGVSLGYRF
jgi:hypothetical protein